MTQTVSGGLHHLLKYSIINPAASIFLWRLEKLFPALP
jgi:hypothetical protein